MKKILTLSMLGLASVSAFAQPSSQANDKNENLALIARGAYLSAAGDCEGCHTIATGQTYGGGRAFPTPFGTIYSTNISSDKTYGIGNYTYQDFVDAVQKGVSPHGNLYPAMPYSAYQKISPADMKALYAFFMQTKPVAQKNRENDVMFPANIRFGLKFWNWLEVKDSPFKATPGKSEAWNRGKYLIEGLGHCGECHTPRNFLMGSETDKALQGNVVDGVNAPNITAQRLKEEGWDAKQLTDFFATGKSAKGTAFGEMFIVEKHSLTQLSKADIDAMVTYLLDGDTAIRNRKIPLAFTAEQQAMPGYGTYMAKCSGCHGNRGEGIPNLAPPLQGNATIANPNIYNTVEVIMNGISSQRYDRNQAYYAMPSYPKMDSKTMADLITFLHQAMTDQTSKVTQQQVESVMQKVNKS